MKKNEKLFLYNRKPINTPYHFAFQMTEPQKCPKLLESLHWHDYLELEIIISGECSHIFNGEKYPISRGSAYLLTFTDYHTLHSLKEETVQTYNFNFDAQALPEDVLNEILNAPFLLKCTFTEEEMAFIKDEIEHLKHELYQESDTMQTIYLKNSFTNLIIFFLRKCKKNNISASSKSIVKNTIITRTITYIKLHFREPITLKSVSKQVGVSPNYLGKLFLDEIGITYSKYISDIRLEYAEDLIKYSDYDIATIASHCAFKSTSHFINSFKKKYGFTPKQYIKNTASSSKLY